MRLEFPELMNFRRFPSKLFRFALVFEPLSGHLSADSSFSIIIVRRDCSNRTSARRHNVNCRFDSLHTPMNFVTGWSAWHCSNNSIKYSQSIISTRIDNALLGCLCVANGGCIHALRSDLLVDLNKSMYDPNPRNLPFQMRPSSH